MKMNLVFYDKEISLAYLIMVNTHPFLILYNINMPILCKSMLRKKLKPDAGLQIKGIHYLFFLPQQTSTQLEKPLACQYRYF